MLSEKKYIGTCIALSLLAACKTKHAEPDLKGYPEAVNKILVNKCAVTGCHNAASKDAAAGLDFSSWDKLFEGSRNGNAVVVPFRPDQSILFFAMNTFPDLGTQLKPTMPYNQSPLSREEVLTIRDWITQGAPHYYGCIHYEHSHDARCEKYSPSHEAKRLLVLNQGCDLLSLMNPSTGLLMRSIDIGATSQTESPHYAHLSRDGKYFYVCFSSGEMLQKFSAEDGSFVSQANIGNGIWSSFALSPDGQYAFVIDWNSNGSIAVVDLEKMTLQTRWAGFGLLAFPHGAAVFENYLYVTALYGNFIYKIDITDISNPDFAMIPLQPGETPSPDSKYDPHSIIFSPDRTQYAVSCQKSNELRFFSLDNDSLLAVVKTGPYPQCFQFSIASDYVFVSCTEDELTFPGKTGSVSIINYKNYSFVKSIYTGFQPHGIEVFDEVRKVYVANRNISPSGPAPHHTTSCGKRNGYMTAIDLNTLELVPGYKAELSADPYAIVYLGTCH